MRIAVAGGTGTVGRHVVDGVRHDRHECVVLSRSDGVDLTTGDGLARALGDVDVVVDVTNSGTLEGEAAEEFFTGVAGTLQGTGAEQGVKHIVTLSIVGIDRVDFGYYRAKLAQERATGGGPVPVTILRATQFHEFVPQMLSTTRYEGRASVFDMTVQPVAARTLGTVLAELAAGPPLGRAPELAGPQRGGLVDLARAYVARRGWDITVEPDTASMAGATAGALLPGAGARVEGPGFDEWLASPEAAAFTLER